MAGAPHAEQQARARQLFEIADTQAGYFTAQQAHAAGYSQQLQAYNARVANWHRVGRGLYRLPNYPVTTHEQYAELNLWSRTQQGQPQATLGFETALALHELSDLIPERIHLIVPPGFRKVPPKGVVLHTGHVAPGDLQHGPGYRVTTPLRTLLDLAGTPLSPEHLHQGLRDALQRGLVRRRTLEQRLADLPATTPAAQRLNAALAAL